MGQMSYDHRKGDVRAVVDVYKECPEFESDRFKIRFVEEEDVEDLLEVYSDKNALPFFNSDNCNGDNFYYPTREKMQEAIAFWLSSYETRWFVRFTIIDKRSTVALGTIEMFRRESADTFNGDGVLRLDVRSDHENETDIFDMISLVLPKFYGLFGCDGIITKAPNYAVERIKAITKCGFKKSNELLIGTHDGYAYNGYWKAKNKEA